jgi:hypothetical protein
MLLAQRVLTWHAVLLTNNIMNMAFSQIFSMNISEIRAFGM